MKILIADDSRTMRMTLRAILEDWGHEVEEAETGYQALERLVGPNPPRLAVLDWLMPDLDGPDVCRMVRRAKLDFQPYLVLLTSKDTKEDLVEGLSMGANDYIGKPFHTGELQARLRVGERQVELETALAERMKALEEASAHIRTLQGMLPICMYCHKIRDDQETWQRLEAYITEHTDASLSHGICPDCRDKFLEG